jgi:hypothetical protein
MLMVRSACGRIRLLVISYLFLGKELAHQSKTHPLESACHVVYFTSGGNFQTSRLRPAVAGLRRGK